MGRRRRYPSGSTGRRLFCGGVSAGFRPLLSSGVMGCLSSMTGTGGRTLAWRERRSRRQSLQAARLPPRPIRRAKPATLRHARRRRLIRAALSPLLLPSRLRLLRPGPLFAVDFRPPARLLPTARPCRCPGRRPVPCLPRSVPRERALRPPRTLGVSRVPFFGVAERFGVPRRLLAVPKSVPATRRPFRRAKPRPPVLVARLPAVPATRRVPVVTRPAARFRRALLIATAPPAAKPVTTVPTITPAGPYVSAAATRPPPTVNVAAVATTANVDGPVTGPSVP
jgi:hypothetical protein